MIAFLSSIKLSITQWIMISLAGIIGALVIALKIQGGRLHASQVSLLTQGLNAAIDAEDGNIGKAKDRLALAKKAYEEAP